MDTLIDRLKAQARKLHNQVKQREPLALARIRALRELRDADEDTLAANVKRRHALAVLAQELGFEGWPHAVAVLGGEDVADFGTLLYPAHFSSRLNIWCATYEEARSIRQQQGGYLLAYQRQFFIAESGFIESLGLDPDDLDWHRIGRDWVHPTEPEARERLYARLIHARQQAQLTRS